MQERQPMLHPDETEQSLSEEEQAQELRELEEAEADRLALLNAWQAYYAQHPEVAQIQSDRIVQWERDEGE